METVKIHLKFGREFGVIFKIFKYLGFNYIEFQEHDNNDTAWESDKTKYSKSQFVFLALRLIIFLALVALCIIENLEKLVGDEGRLMILIQYIFDILSLVVSFTLLFQSFFATRRFKKFYKNIRVVLKMLHQNFDIIFNWQKTKKNVHLRAFIFWSIHAGLFLIKADASGYNPQMLVNYFAGLFLIAFLFYFIFIVEILNQTLALLVKSFHELSRPTSISHISIIASHNANLKSIYAVQRLSSNLRKIRACQKVYNIILDCGKAVNESFGLTMLLILIGIVLQMTVEGYKVFINLFTGDGNTNKSLAQGKSMISIFSKRKFKKIVFC